MISSRGTKYGVVETFRPSYVHLSDMSSGLNSMARSHDGVLMLMFQTGFMHTNTLLLGCLHSWFNGSCGVISAPDALARIVSCALIVANFTIPLVFVGNGYSLCTVNFAAVLSGTSIDRPLGVRYDVRVP